MSLSRPVNETGGIMRTEPQIQLSILSSLKNL